MRESETTAKTETGGKPVTIRGEGLTIADVVRVARAGKPTRLTDDESVLRRVQASRQAMLDAVERGEPIYGVTTVFGGMADIWLPKEEAEALQDNIPWPHKTGAGPRLPDSSVRAAMLLRANSLMRGASGVRMEIVDRLVRFLNAGATPHVHEMGSIGASGDLVPLAYILACIVGSDSAYSVQFEGRETDALTVLEKLGLPRLGLAAKEGLSVMNGTSVMAGIAAECVHDARNLLALSMGAHALYVQGLGGTNQSFAEFVQEQKPHPGQIWSASEMRALLAGSKLSADELGGPRRFRKHHLVQDRYSLRCLPQYMGPIVDGIAAIARQVEVEMNSATDNPLVDPDTGMYYFCGNFLGQYVGVAMDQLRYYIGLLAKHLDTQIALLVAPEFNNGLPPSLVGNPERRVNLGLKGLQISGNSVMPLLSFLGASLVDRFPTHAEQFNQNINSQGFGSANLARQSVEGFRQYMAMALMFGVQAADLRTHVETGHYDARKTLAPATVPLYEAILETAGVAPSEQKPYVWNDDEQSLDFHIRDIAADIAADGRIPRAVADVRKRLEGHVPFCRLGRWDDFGVGNDNGNPLVPRPQW